MRFHVLGYPIVLLGLSDSPFCMGPPKNASIWTLFRALSGRPGHPQAVSRCLLGSPFAPDHREIHRLKRTSSGNTRF